MRSAIQGILTALAAVLTESGEDDFEQIRGEVDKILGPRPEQPAAEIEYGKLDPHKIGAAFTTVQVLDVIDASLNRDYDELPFDQKGDRARLWHILTALRGPDVGDSGYSNGVKWNTTAVIRRRAFPLAAGNYMMPADVNHDRWTITNYALLAAGHDVSEHFRSHVVEAQSALDALRPVTAAQLQEEKVTAAQLQEEKSHILSAPAEEFDLDDEDLDDEDEDDDDDTDDDPDC